MSFLENNFFLLAITFGIFFFAKLLQKKTGLDVRVFDDALTFKIAMMVVNYMKYLDSQEY